MCWQAMAVKGVFSDGFQMQTSPQTQASRAVPAPNRHREVKGRYNADNTQRVILLIHAVVGALAVHG
jgi:hypothetical protein